MENLEQNKLERAKKHVKELQGFYAHFTAYIIVNLFISTMKIYGNMSDGETFFQAFWDFGTFAVWFFWGIGMTSHALHVFGGDLIFGKGWEERKIKEFMEKDEQEYKRISKHWE